MRAGSAGMYASASLCQDEEKEEAEAKDEEG
jgi:hypothetical protein